MDDKNKRLTTCMLGIVIGGENIDWQLPSSVQTVCELLGVKKTTVYKYRKQKRYQVCTAQATDKKRCSRQPTLLLLDTFWELNCDESPNTDKLKSLSLVVQIITDMIPCLTTQENA